MTREMFVSFLGSRGSLHGFARPPPPPVPWRHMVAGPPGRALQSWCQPSTTLPFPPLPPSPVLSTRLSLLETVRGGEAAGPGRPGPGGDALGTAFLAVRASVTDHPLLAAARWPWESRRHVQRQQKGHHLLLASPGLRELVLPSGASWPEYVMCPRFNRSPAQATVVG